MTLQLARWPNSPGSSNLVLCGDWLGTGAWLAHASLWEQDVCDAILAGDSRTIRQMIEERAQFEEEDYPLYVAVVAPDMFACLPNLRRAIRWDFKVYSRHDSAEFRVYHGESCEVRVNDEFARFLDFPAEAFWLGRDKERVWPVLNAREGYDRLIAPMRMDGGIGVPTGQPLPALTQTSRVGA